MTVKVDPKAEVFQERLELEVRVDENLILHAHARSLNRRHEDRCEIHNLEFGLRLRKQVTNGTNDAADEESAGNQQNGRDTNAVGTLTVRANVTDVEDLAKIPGEYLYQHNPGYFDRRRSPPREQDLEKLYYQPCSLCGRASNDPACRCQRSLYHGSERPV